MRKKLLFVYNPHSGTQLIARKLSNIVDLFTKHGYDVTCHPTQARNDCIETVKANCNDFDLTVVSGGDGTLNEAINGLMAAKCQKPFGYIPAGSTNDFSHSVGIPLKVMNAAEAVISGEEFACDIGKHNDRYFTYVAGFGALTEVSYSTPQDAKNALGFLAYVLEGIASLPTIKEYNISYKCSEHEGEGSYLLGLVTNTLHVAGLKNRMSDDIALDDGLFEVILVKTPKKLSDLHNLTQDILKRDFSSGALEYFKTDRLTITCEETLAWTLDGENGGEHKVSEIVNYQKALSVMRKPKN